MGERRGYSGRYIWYISHRLDNRRCDMLADLCEGRFSKDNMLIPNLPAPLPVDWLKRVGIEKIGPVSSLCNPANIPWYLRLMAICGGQSKSQTGFADCNDLAKSRRLRLYPCFNLRL